MNISEVKIKRITKLNRISSVRNVSVNKNHTIVSENGIITHNCNSTQPALRAMIEEFANNCRFIFTCNYKEKIIPAIHSRCSVVDFKIPKTERVDIAKKFHAAVIKILKGEGVSFDEKVLTAFIAKYFPYCSV